MCKPLRRFMSKTMQTHKGSNKLVADTACSCLWCSTVLIHPPKERLKPFRELQKTRRQKHHQQNHKQHFRGFYSPFFTRCSKMSHASLVHRWTSVNFPLSCETHFYFVGCKECIRPHRQLNIDDNITKDTDVCSKVTSQCKVTWFWRHDLHRHFL